MHIFLYKSMTLIPFLSFLSFTVQFSLPASIICCWFLMIIFWTDIIYHSFSAIFLFIGFLLFLIKTCKCTKGHFHTNSYTNPHNLIIIVIFTITHSRKYMLSINLKIQSNIYVKILLIHLTKAKLPTAHYKLWLVKLEYDVALFITR